MTQADFIYQARSSTPNQMGNRGLSRHQIPSNRREQHENHEKRRFDDLLTGPRFGHAVAEFECDP